MRRGVVEKPVGTEGKEVEEYVARCWGRWETFLSVVEEVEGVSIERSIALPQVFPEKWG